MSVALLLRRSPVDGVAVRRVSAGRGGQGRTVGSVHETVVYDVRGQDGNGEFLSCWRVRHREGGRGCTVVGVGHRQGIGSRKQSGE